jgi:tRNA (guanine37-N1)-methyltransferase
MKVTVLTLFPELVQPYFHSSIMGKAVERGLIEPQVTDIRQYATDRHRTCDDAPYGGGAGMVLKAEPLGAALDDVGGRQQRTIYPTPAGRLLTQKRLRELASEEELVFICGRYEGIDQRVIDYYVDDELTLGDYVISSGEIASLVIIDGIYRLLEGVITQDSLEEESFQGGLLEYPHYTRPEVYKGMRVPDVLLSGHHERIRMWRHRMQVQKTREYRPDLLNETEEGEQNGSAETSGEQPAEREP